MSATFMSHQGSGDQREDNDQDNTLFVFRMNENVEQTFHFVA